MSLSANDFPILLEPANRAGQIHKVPSKGHGFLCGVVCDIAGDFDCYGLPIGSRVYRTSVFCTHSATLVAAVAHMEDPIHWYGSMITSDSTPMACLSRLGLSMIFATWSVVTM